MLFTHIFVENNGKHLISDALKVALIVRVNKIKSCKSTKLTTKKRKKKTSQQCSNEFSLCVLGRQLKNVFFVKTRIMNTACGGDNGKAYRTET